MKRLSLLAIVPLGACFSPSDPPSSSATDGTSDTATASSTTPTSGSAVTSVSNSSPSATDPSATSATATESTNSATTTGTESGSESETQTESSTGTLIEPLCGDGVVVATEICFDDPPLDYSVTRMPVDVAIGDITINGLSDVVALSQGEADNPRINVLEADGVGGFVSGASSNAPAYGARVRIYDTDGDGDDDIVALGSEGITTYRNQGAFLSTNSINHFGGEWQIAALEIADVDGDDIVDVLISEAYSHGYYPGEINGANWTANEAGRQDLPSVGEGAAGMMAGAFSFDGDDDLDIIALNQYYAEIEVSTNNGDGTFTAHSNPAMCSGFDGGRRGATGDLDNDGDTDVVITCMNGDVSVAIDDGTGDFASYDTLPLAGAYRPELVDIDGDGFLDILVGSTSLDRAVVFVNDGAGEFELSDTQFMGLGPVRGATVADLNEDGAMDVVIASDDGAAGHVQIYLATP